MFFGRRGHQHLGSRCWRVDLNSKRVGRVVTACYRGSKCWREIEGLWAFATRGRYAENGKLNSSPALHSCVLTMRHNCVDETAKDANAQARLEDSLARKRREKI